MKQSFLMSRPFLTVEKKSKGTRKAGKWKLKRPSSSVYGIHGGCGTGSIQINHLCTIPALTRWISWSLIPEKIEGKEMKWCEKENSSGSLQQSGNESRDECDKQANYYFESDFKHHVLQKNPKNREQGNSQVSLNIWTVCLLLIVLQLWFRFIPLQNGFIKGLSHVLSPHECM